MIKVKTLLENVALAAITIVAVGLAGLRAKQWWDSRHLEPPRVVENWRDFAKEGQVVGPADATVTIVEFADYECPFCRTAAKEVARILEEFPNEVRLVYRHYPLSFHPLAIPSARAALCAEEQDRFAAYHRLLYDSATTLDSRPWTQLAAMSGIGDSAAFRRCVEQDGPLPSIARDTVAGNRLALGGTPLYLVNEIRLAGYPRPGYIEKYVRQELRRSRRSK